MAIERRWRISKRKGIGGFQNTWNIQSTCEKHKHHICPDVDDAEGDRAIAGLHQALI